MTIRIENSPTNTDSLPTVLFNNLFLSGTLAASSEAAGYPKENAVSENTNKSWKPSSLPATLSVDLGTARSVDSFALVAHNCGTKGNVVILQTSNAGSIWLDRCIVSPSDDTTIFGLLTSVSSRYWRLEFSTKNLLQRTEEFENTYWTKTATTITLNSTTSPIGDNSAQTLVETATSGTHSMSRSISFVSGRPYTLSIYVKNQSARNIRLALPTTQFGGVLTNATFNTSTGAVTGSAGGVTTSVETLADGWFRLSISKVATSTSSGSVTISLIQGTTTSSYTGDGTSGVFVWGAQLEVGSSPSAYFKISAASTDNQPNIGVAMLGERFTFPAGVRAPYTPVWLSQTYDLLTSTTMGGQFLGNRILRKGAMTAINLVSFERAFAESNLLPFREHYNLGKAFVWAAGPSIFTKDVGYVWRTENSVMAPTFDENGSWMSVSMEVNAYGE
jgi:hypothetical protein